MPLRVSIHPGSNVTISRQIVEQVCAAVFAGLIDDDEPLPSVRALAEELVINPTTVARAYAELAKEGIVESRAGRGMFVSKRRQIYTKAERNRRLEQTVTSLVTDAFMLGFSIEDMVEAVAAKAREIRPPAAGRASNPGKPELERGSR